MVVENKMSSQSLLATNPAAPPVAIPLAADLMQKAVLQVDDQKVSTPVILSVTLSVATVEDQVASPPAIVGDRGTKVQGTEAEINLKIMEEGLVTRLQGPVVGNRKAKNRGTVAAGEEEVSNPRMVVLEREAVGGRLLYLTIFWNGLGMNV